VFDKVHEEALKYTSRTEFQRESSGAYDAAWRYDWLEDVCAYMPQTRLPSDHFNNEFCHQLAQKFQTRGEFRRKETHAYDAASRKGFLDEICAHMPEVPVVKTNWSKESCHEEALKFTSRSEFLQGCRRAYDAATRRGVYT
jgi:hypothetical protein